MSGPFRNAPKPTREDMLTEEAGWEPVLQEVDSSQDPPLDDDGPRPATADELVAIARKIREHGPGFRFPDPD